MSFNFFYKTIILSAAISCYAGKVSSQKSIADLRTDLENETSVKAKILRLKPVTFELKYRNPEHQISYGFIAQDVQQVFPGMVTISSYEVEKGVTIPDFHTLDYNDFKMIAVKGIQEEEAIIQKQQDIQNEINSRLEAIEKKLSLKNK